jgi:hypothetical protein
MPPNKEGSGQSLVDILSLNIDEGLGEGNTAEAA